MARVKVITDSTAYIRKEYLIMKDISSVPLSVYFENEVLQEGFPGEFDSFYERLKSSNDFPTTSQPSIKSFYDEFMKALEDDKAVVAIVLSSELSGTFNSAMSAAKMCESDKIAVIDSETCGPNLRFLAELANELSLEGKSKDEIVEIINIEKKKTGINLTVGTLEYLKKGGRLNTAQAFIGTLLNIKPIIALIDGKLVPVDKIRGKSRAIEAMISKIPVNVKRISICQIHNLAEALEVKQLIHTNFPGVQVEIDEMGPVVGSHLGPLALGICYKW